MLWLSVWVFWLKLCGVMCVVVMLVCIRWKVVKLFIRLSRMFFCSGLNLLLMCMLLNM